MASSLPPLFIVFNAASGSADSDRAMARVHELLNAAGQPHEILAVRGNDDLTRTAVRAVHAAREAHGCVVAAGGDGTLNAVAQVVWNADQLMGVLPQGTFNYFGRTHGMPADLDDSVAALLTAREQPITVGLLGERVFLVNASVGLYPRLLEDREAAKRRFGRHRVVALLSGLGTLLRGRSVLTLELSFEGQTRVIRTRTLFVGNNPLQLAALGLRHATDVEQGRLAAITLQPLSGPRTLWLLLRGALGMVMIGCFVFALKRMPLSTAYSIFFVAPLLITALSVPILGERVGPRRWTAIAIGLLGVLVVLRPTGEGVLTTAGFAVLVAALGYAVSAITVRVLARTDSTQAITFWLLALMGLGAGALAWPDWVPLRAEHAWLIGGIGIAGAIGAFGGVLVNIAFRQSFLANSSGDSAYVVLIAFYLFCLAPTWAVYLRPSASRLADV